MDTMINFLDIAMDTILDPMNIRKRRQQDSDGSFNPAMGGTPSPISRENAAINMDLLSMPKGTVLEMLGISPGYVERNRYHACPYCDTEDIAPIVSDIPGAPDVCPNCGGFC